jgi:ankyrin repeat protein
MTDLKEDLSNSVSALYQATEVLLAAMEVLLAGDDGNSLEYCPIETDVSSLEAAAAAASTAAALHAEVVYSADDFTSMAVALLRPFLHHMLTRNDRNRQEHGGLIFSDPRGRLYSWSAHGFELVARIVKAVLSCNWCVDKVFIDHADEKDRRTALMCAAENGHDAVVQLLLADDRVDKTSIDQADERGCTALLYACLAGHQCIVELLLADPRVDKTTLDWTDDNGATCLLHAADRGHTAIVELLLADDRFDKASINHATEFGWTPLICAAPQEHVSILKLLLGDPRMDKASIDHSTEDGTTALMSAAESGNVAAVELLLADGRLDMDSVGQENIHGHTALTYATYHAHFDVVKVLVNSGLTSWHSLTEVAYNSASIWRCKKHTDWDIILSIIATELTYRSMCVIYPPINRELWPVPVLVPVPAESGVESRPGAADQIEWHDDIQCHSHSHSHCHSHSVGVTDCSLLSSSFFKSPLFDVNVLGIVHEYAAYPGIICSMNHEEVGED